MIKRIIKRIFRRSKQEAATVPFTALGFWADSGPETDKSGE